MDALFRALVRQYAATSDDNELAHRIASMVVRSNGGGPETEKSFEEQIKEYSETQDAYQALLSGKIVDALQSLVAKYPEVEAIRWRQYTPSFNDGDPCIFGVNNPDVKFKPEGTAAELPEHGLEQPWSQASSQVSSEDGNGLEGPPIAGMSQDNDDSDHDDDNDDDDDDDDNDTDADDDDGEGERGDGFLSTYEIHDEKKRQIADALDTYLMSIPDDLMERAFGNGVEVTLSAMDFDIDEHIDTY